MPAEPIDMAAIAPALEGWFETAARDLPWRTNRTGYSALVSEAMLQQTQVARVVERYEAFIERFPTVADLAAADEQDVLAMWQGLGYYRRARSLHAAARMIVEELHGEVPSEVPVLLRLPGVGRYTAGAIASIVHQRRAPLVDGNAMRVFVRLGARDGETADAAATTWGWRQATALVEAAAGPGAANEGLMELGATVCTPRSPSCGDCPLAPHCAARRQGRQDELPPRRAATKKPLHMHAVVVQRSGHLLLEQRPAKGPWSSMWQVPTIESDRELASAQVSERLPFRAATLEFVDRFAHSTTHRDVTIHVYRATTRARRGRWVPHAELDTIPMSNAARRVLEVAG